METVIWDFNGTLLDDIDLVVRTVNRQLGKRGLGPLTAAEYRDVFGFPVEAYYRRLGVTFEEESMVELSADFFADYEPRLVDCSLHEGIGRALGDLAEAGLHQFVLSAMEERMLRETLEALGILNQFIAVYGLAHQKGDSKLNRGRELMADHAIDPTAALMIGDTAHDAEVAESLGLGCALIARGHQSRARLEETRWPVYDDVEELMSALDLNTK